MAGHPARTRRIDTAAPQRRSTAAANVDFVTDRQTWLGVQNGIVHFAPAPRASAPRYLLDGRDLSDYLQKIRSGIAWQNAAAIIGAMDAAAAPELDIDDFHSLFGLARSISGSAMFYQKMLVQRRVRPDAVGGLITLRAMRRRSTHRCGRRRRSNSYKRETATHSYRKRIRTALRRIRAIRPDLET